MEFVKKKSKKKEKSLFQMKHLIWNMKMNEKWKKLFQSTGFKNCMTNNNNNNKILLRQRGCRYGYTGHGYKRDVWS